MMGKMNLVSNTRYKKSGTRTYAHLMRKYRFYPTKEGPYSIHRTIHQTGRPFSSKPVGGRIIFQDVMEKQVLDDRAEQVGDEDIQQDAPYFVPVEIGTPAQTVNLVIDTASPHCWVRSPGLAQPDGHRHVFDPSQSSTFTSAGDQTWEISYINGSSISGSFGMESITLGDLTIRNQDIGLADMMSSAMISQFSGDGVLGLSMDSAWSGVNSVTESIRRQDVIPLGSKLFALKLGSWGGCAPFCSFGSIEQDLVSDCAEDIYYTDVDSSHGYWMFDSVSAFIGGKTIERLQNKAIVDTSVDLTLLDDTVCQAIYDAIPGAFYDNECQGFVFPSSVTCQQYPSIEVDVGGKLIAIQTAMSAFAETKSGYVYGGFQSRGSLNFDVLGATFLRGIYAVFDVDGARFGIAQPLGASDIPPPKDNSSQSSPSASKSSRIYAPTTERLLS